MAKMTSKSYRNQVLYSIFVRNYSTEGTFDAVRRDLDRIRALGADMIWLLPIHPIGKIARKGSLGSPYAIRDYRTVNPEYGTMEDFKALVDAIHSRGMKCIIDVVYNHTSPDSLLAAEHPDWFYHKPDGSFGNKVGEWPDVIDLDYTKPALWDYQIDTLRQWAQIVDGFRCDVAPLIPLNFWLRARREVEAVLPGCFWLAESVEPVFTVENRARGMVSLSDSEIFQAFDACYEYDVFGCFKEVIEGSVPLAEYAQAVQRQEAVYPDNYVKLRFLENHDNTRAAFLLPDKASLANWTAFCCFQKGMTLLYAGQERGAAHLPSLFDKDVVNWREGGDLSPLLAALFRIKKDPLFTDSRYEVAALPYGILRASHTAGGRQMIGIFSTRGLPSLVPVNVPDGSYRNEIDGEPVEVHRGALNCKGRPIILNANGKV